MNDNRLRLYWIDVLRGAKSSNPGLENLKELFKGSPMMSPIRQDQILGKCDRVTHDVASLPTLPRNPRYRSLDLWRGVACLMVVVGHSSVSLPDGSAGVAKRMIA